MRHLASVQSLTRAAHEQYLMGRMQPIRGRAGRVMASKVVTRYRQRHVDVDAGSHVDVAAILDKQVVVFGING